MNLIDTLSGAIRSPDDQEGRFYGFVAGTVTEVESPTDNAKLGRVKARLRGMEDNAQTGWLVPFWIGGIEGTPHKGDPVMVGFEDGDVNRGFYGWHPSSKTKDRPQEWMVLGLTFAAMYNNLVTLANQIKSQYNGHTHTYVLLGVDTLTTAPVTGVGVPRLVTAADGGKMQKASGEAVADSSGDKKALSGRVKVGI